MKGEKLFRIIGLTDDDLIDEAEDDKPKPKAINNVWSKKIAFAACAVLFIGIGIFYLINSGPVMPGFGGGGSGHGDSSVFAHYAGPVLPLNVSGDTNGITANRSIHFDFGSNETGQNNDLMITDSYTLTNNTAGDKTIDVFYPFISNITDSAKYSPQLTVNGESQKCSLLIGSYSGGFTGVNGQDGMDNTTLNLSNIESWEGYKSLLEDGRYFQNTGNEKAFTDQKVTVYTFHDITYPEEYRAATLAIDFDLPQGSTVITYGMNGASFENGGSHYRYDYFVSHSEGQRIIILGEPPAKYIVQGYENGACDKKVDAITGTVKTETMMLSQVIKDCMADYLAHYGGSPDTISPLVTNELVFDAVASMFQYTPLGSSPKDRYNWMRLDDLIGESYTMERVMYLKAQVTIPSGKSVELESEFKKDASYDFAGAGPKENQGVTGYDMMTKLASNLEFIGQKASIDLPQTYEIIRQNFGFDPVKGITEVSLDMAQEHYYLEVKRKSIR